MNTTFFKSRKALALVWQVHESLCSPPHSKEMRGAAMALNPLIKVGKIQKFLQVLTVLCDSTCVCVCVVHFESSMKTSS